jgi:hypothetical protein
MLMGQSWYIFWGDFVVLQHVLETLDQSGCGYTLDSFKFGLNGERAIQWVVARPVSDHTPSNWPPLVGALEELPADHNLDLGISNSSAELPSCPFQPSFCSGTHLVASGVGIIS